MKVPFLDLKKQYNSLKTELEPVVLEVMSSCAYIGGRYVNDFESKVAEYLEVKHAIGCSSGTAALILALRACNIKPGDEVITTPFTFFATAEAIACVGAKPVFVDVRPDDYTIDPEKIEEEITGKTKAILPVHIFGAMCDMDKIMAIARKHGLKVIEDDAQAIGSEYHGRKAGTIGDIGCFSFYPTKNLGGCGDGGLVTTNDDCLAINLRSLREHGAGKNGAKARENMTGVSSMISTGEQVTELYDPYKYYNYLIAYNSRLDALQAAVLSVKLGHLEEFNKQRDSIAQRYIKGLTANVRCPKYKKDNKTCWHQFVVCTNKKQELCQALSEKEIGVGTFYPVPLHKQAAFDGENSRVAKQGCPVAENLAKETVCLPIFPEMTDEQVQYVIETVNDFFEGEKA
ncbi:DegT/DnrJ/EryC1/StrS family aminotransferase [Anaerovibrio lipolyticus]|uniref:DegT/DnrJ/EryC1/StrS family aminotransferase n=1 Tax=Anaerovibrio lipolyticus TaxID=82374 RepID=UPI00048207C8|nr:DegT/DnrJ/EryC1/StrS family aminotransferase [Anaerovibrio lipolyticus]